MASNIPIKYRSIRLIDGILTVTNTLGQSGSRSNGNEEVLYTP